MADEKQTFKLDLDAKEFIEKAFQAKEAIGKISDAEGLKGLVEKLAHASKLIGAIGAVAFAFKGALDLTLEAEQVAKINKQFEVLAKNVGISADQVKEGLAKAVGGLADDTDVLQAANKAIVQLGDNARNLVSIMELARKVTSVMGGDLIQNFETISTAIANGNARMLRQLGLNIDANAAMIAYAKATNQSVAALTENEKRQAMLNAVMEKGRTVLSGTSSQTETATSTLKKISVELKSFAENIAVLFDRVFGDIVRKNLDATRQALSTLNNAFKSFFGSDAEKAEIRAKNLAAQITQWQKNITQLQEVMQKDVRFQSAERQAELNKQIEEYRAKIAAAEVDVKKLESAEAKRAEPKAGAADTVKITEIEAEKKRLILTKFEADILALETARIADQERAAGTAVELQQLYAEKRLNIENRAAAEEAMIRSQLALGEIGDQELAAAKIEEIRARSVAQLTTLERGLYDQRIAWLQQEAEAQARTSAGFSAGFKAAAADAGRDMGNFAKLGSQVFGAFSKSAKSSLMDLGSGSKDAGEAMRGFLFGALADIAEAQGSIMIAQGFMGNFAAAAAGAGLLILAGFLRSQAQGASRAMEGAAGGGGGGGAVAAPSPAALAGPDTSALEQAQAKPKREVTIQIQGHYLDTEGSRRALMEMIRQETDATSFKYVEIGQGA